jgi:hypothetical protein
MVLSYQTHAVHEQENYGTRREEKQKDQSNELVFFA